MRSTELDERALIGAALLTGDGHASIDLEPADFESDFYGAVWKSIRTMREVDQVALESEFFDKRHELAECVNGIPTFANMEKIAARISEAGHRRRIMATLVKAHSLVDAGSGIPEVSGMVAATFDDVRTGEDWKHIMEFLKPAYTAIETAQITGESSMFVPTGFIDFDRKFRGLQKNGLIVVAGRPAMGKSAFAAALARNAAANNPVLIVSMEMSGVQIATRFYSSESGISLEKLTGGGMTKSDYADLVDAQVRLGSSGININDKRCRGLSDVCAESRRFKRVHGDVGMIVVDYLTLMELPEGNNRNNQIAEATRQLTNLAGDIGCPVVLLSQLNRDLEKRADKRPTMADLRDSGAIEQDAHQIIFTFRPEVYDKDPKYKGIALVDMAKNRNGPTGTVTMAWIAESTVFRDLAKDGFR